MIKFLLWLFSFRERSLKTLKYFLAWAYFSNVISSIPATNEARDSNKLSRAPLEQLMIVSIISMHPCRSSVLSTYEGLPLTAYFNSVFSEIFNVVEVFQFCLVFCPTNVLIITLT